MPFSSPNQKPSRNEALEYYRKVAEHYKLEFRQYQTVSGVTGEDGDFTITTIDRFSRHRSYGARKVVIATGYYDLPNYLEVPGEELPKVLHYYHDPHPYYDQKVLVVGGKNSAAIAALDLWRHGAHVTLVHRGEKMHHHVKYWILPDINNRIKNGEVAAHFSSSVARITEDAVDLFTPEGTVTIENDYVFALTGYHPDFDFLAGLGVRMEGQDRCPACDPQSLESNIPGIYLAGVIVAGMRTNEIFIENGRFHGAQIAQDMEAKLAPGRAPLKVG
jgi:thioredoxin reductase (NADPH)